MAADNTAVLWDVVLWSRKAVSRRDNLPCFSAPSLRGVWAVANRVVPANSQTFSSPSSQLFLSSHLLSAATHNPNCILHLVKTGRVLAILTFRYRGTPVGLSQSCSELQGHLPAPTNHSSSTPD